MTKTKRIGITISEPSDKKLGLSIARGDCLGEDTVVIFNTMKSTNGILTEEVFVDISELEKLISGLMVLRRHNESDSPRAEAIKASEGDDKGR